MAVDIINRGAVEEKTCSTCRMWKPLTDFYRDSSHGRSQGQRHCRCKDCYRKGRKNQNEKTQPGATAVPRLFWNA